MNVLMIGFTIIVFITVIYMFKKGINIGLTMVALSVIIALLSKMPVKDYGVCVFKSIFASDTVSLIIVMFSVLLVENIMRTTGDINKIVESLKNIFTDQRIAAITMPAIIGMLPSPGGARFSCPIVDEVINENTSKANKAYINYWFRHIWMDSFILYPGIILAAKICKVSVIDLFVRMIPFMIISFIIGIIFCVKDVKKEVVIAKVDRKTSLKQLIIAMMPIISLIVGYLILINFTKWGFEITAIIVSTSLFWLKKYNLKKIIDTMLKAFQINLTIIIIGVMIFKGVIFESGLIQNLPQFMHNYGIPIEILYLVLPFIGGLTSGIAVSFVSLSFPILYSLGIQGNLWFCAFAMVAGFVGVMVTPLHLCAVLTADYFKMKLEKLILRVAASEITIVLIVCTLCFLII